MKIIFGAFVLFIVSINLAVCAFMLRAFVSGLRGNVDSFADPE